MAEYDIAIRGGTIVDGTGEPSYKGDVAIRGSSIAAVGRVDGTGREEIDATGCLVTPGFIDVHTHYDGQATWESRLAPSSGHGVTTVVTGNCGVGFAPCRPEDRQKLIKVMEGVEDIPELVMAEGLPWNWQSFPSYLDILDSRRFDIDIAVQVPHSPLRVFVMGERGMNHEPSTPEDRARMAALVTEAIGCGAIGVSTSRSLNHRTKNGVLAPSVTTAKDEVLALAQGLGAANAGVFQLITEATEPPEGEIELIREISDVSGRPVSFTLAQLPEAPDGWRTLMNGLGALNDAGHEVRGQVFPRPVGVLLGLDLSLNPILTKPSYARIAHLPLPERVKILRDPEYKARVLAEESVPDPQPITNRLLDMVNEMFPLGEKPDYAPTPDQNLGQRARRLGVSALSLAYDLMLEQDGQALLYLPGANFCSGTLAEVREMMTHPNTILGLGDGGAHYGLICDASFPTFVLTYWARDVEPALRFSPEWAIAALSHRPAAALGLNDRGLLAPGYKADVNIIDHEKLKLHPPKPVFDLPAGGRRLQQRADGYRATLVSGAVTYRDGKATDVLPGRLVRSSSYSPLRNAA